MKRLPITSVHWCVLFLACALMFGNYYCYDIPAALNVPLQKWLKSDYAEYQSQINMLYSVYSLPNIILPLVGGVLVDSLSPATMLIVFSICVCSGQALFSFGVQQRYYPIMLAGRFLFGLGGESLEVAQASMTTLWFQGRGLAFALGMNLAFARIATAVNDNLSPYLAGLYGTPLAVWAGFIVCVLSFLGGITLIFLNRPSVRCQSGVFVSTAEEVEFKRNRPENDEEGVGSETTGLLQDYGDEQDIQDIPDSRVDSYSSTLLPKSDNIADVTSDEETADEYDEEDETIHFGQIWKFRRSFWLLFMATILTYGSVVPFFHVCTDFFQQKWYHNDPQKAGMVMSLPDIISAIGSPICGLLVDRFGHRSTLIPFSSLLIVLTHVLLTFTDISPMVSMSILGVSYSMFASALWPCVPFLVGRHQIATAYGLMTVALNVSLFSFPFVVALIRSHSSKEDFFGMELFFLALSGLAVLSSLALLYDDIKFGDRKLMRSSFGTTTHLDEVEEGDGGEQYAEEDEEVPEDEWTAKVVGEGIVIPAPVTVIHHRHHHGPPPRLERQFSSSWDPGLSRNFLPADRAQVAEEDGVTSATSLLPNTNVSASSLSPHAVQISPLSPTSLLGFTNGENHSNGGPPAASSSTGNIGHYHTTFCRCYEDDVGQSRRKSRKRLNGGLDSSRRHDTQQHGLSASSSSAGISRATSSRHGQTSTKHLSHSNSVPPRNPRANDRT